MDDMTQRIQAATHEVLAVLQQLRAYRLYRDVDPQRGPPASEAEIRSYEQYLGLRLPRSYRKFLALTNGYTWLAFPGHMLSIQDVLPGGPYHEHIREWKSGMAEAGLGEALDGIVIAYLDQPNNWVYLDPNRRSGDEELAVALHVPGVDPTIYADVAELIASSAERARLAMSWEIERAAKGG